MIRRPLKLAQKSDPPITFSKKDFVRLQHPHDDPLVVMIMIIEFRTQRVLIDNGSSADILYLPVFKQMKILEDRLQPIETPLIGFTGDKIFPLGSIALLVTAWIGAH